jgi:hypothetical protein
VTSNGLSAAAAFQARLEFFTDGVDVMRQNLRRQYSDATPTEIESQLGLGCASVREPSTAAVPAGSSITQRGTRDVATLLRHSA